MTELTEAAVRAEVRAWLEANWNPDLGLVEWRNRLIDSGWGVPHWPCAWHGRDLPVGLVSVVFLLSGAWRLALFALMEGLRDFRGMPITVAGCILAALSYVAWDWPWPVLALLTLGLSFLMVCRVRFFKLSRVLVPTIRRLPDQIRWTPALLIIPIAAIIVEPIPQAVLALGGIYTVFSLLEHRRTPAAAPMQEEIVG